MNCRRLLLLVLVLAVAAGGAWAWLHGRTVDGRSAPQWLALAQRAGQTVAYRATGRTTYQGQSAAFTLTQGPRGRYIMQIEGAGCRCEMGNDGQYAWYRTDTKTVRTASVPAPALPAPNGRILGTGTVAGQPAVQLRVRSGQTVKDISLDRQTGVVLAMTTREDRRTVSRMTVEQIAYRDVAVAESPGGSATLEPASAADLQQLLGTPVQASWLPRGMTERGRFTSWCDCCKGEIGVIRYSDGVRSLTLFQSAAPSMCAMGEGCRMAPSGSALIDSRRIGNLTVIAVGNVERATLQRVLAGLKPHHGT